MNIVRGAAFLMIGSFIAQALSAGTGLLIARRAGLDAYGQYATAFALAGAFAQTFLFGIDSILPREIAKCPRAVANVLVNTLIPVLVWSMLIVAVIVLVGIELGFSGNVLTILLMAAPIFALRGLINLGRSALRGLERMQKDAMIQVIEALLVLVAIAATLAVSPSILHAILAMLAAELLALGYMVHLSMGSFTGSVRFAWRTSIQLMQAAVPVGATFMLMGFNFRLDTIILSAYHSETEVGLYSAAFSIIVLTSAISLVSAAILPRLSALADSNRDEFRNLWGTGLRYTLIIGQGVGMSISWLAPWLIHLLYGVEFTAATPLLRVLGIVATLPFINRYLWDVLIALGEQKSIFLSAIVSALATLLCGLFVIPIWGVYGAAATAIIREVCQLCVLGYFAFRCAPAIRWQEAVWAPVGAALTMLFILIFVQVQHLSDMYALFMLPFGILLYLAALLFTNGIQRRELAGWSKRLAVLAVIAGSAGLLVHPQTALAAQSCPSAYQALDANGDGRAEALQIAAHFSPAAQDQITVYFSADQTDARPADRSCWTDYVDFIDETWVFDADANGDANLIIYFARAGNAVTAELYDDQDGDNAVTYAVQDNRVVIGETLPKTRRAATWSVRIVAPAGWWVRPGDGDAMRANYNLNLYVNGNIEAVFGTSQFADLLQNDANVDFEIQVYDVDDDGHPEYDLRFLPALPRLRGLGGFNTHLMMNLADNEEVLPPGAYWPYVGAAAESTNNVIQRTNSQRQPPILVDWNASKIVAIHEMVASRAGENNCFYYSSTRPQAGAPSDMNFEAPFCFYDLAGDQDAIPELIIRNQYWTPNDPIFLLGQFPHPLAQVRYSWDQNNDGALDYALGLTGRKTLDASVRVLDYELNTVPYADFPAWAMQNNWDTAVFVAAEKEYFSNEGIYEVDLPLDLVANYLTGRTTAMPEADIDEYMRNVISGSTRGLRLERNLHFDQPPQLYVSPIDGQVHLLNAHDGIWQLQAGGAIYYINLDADPYIDQWQYVDEQGAAQTLIQAAGWLIQADGQNVQLTPSAPAKAMLTFAPPQSQDEYSQLSTTLAAAQRSWQAVRPGETGPTTFLATSALFSQDSIHLSGVQMTNFRVTDAGFRFVLDATALPAAADQQLAGRKLAPAQYVVTVADGQLAVSPLASANPSFAVDSAQLPAQWLALEPYTVVVVGSNSGNADLSPLNVTLIATDAAGNEISVAESEQPLLAEASTRYRYSWTPPHAGAWTLSARAATGAEVYAATDLLALTVNAAVTPVLPWFFKELGAARWGLLLLAGSMTVIVLGILLLIMPALRVQREV
ncbi:MAG: oligosaccharide flippase family protein [Caldilineaceae bacterium]|nr:oligosaccharide flippase family protein [Caldilineaceae bacterium]